MEHGSRRSVNPRSRPRGGVPRACEVSGLVRSNVSGSGLMVEQVAQGIDREGGRQESQRTQGQSRVVGIHDARNQTEISKYF